ncbi:ABC transporter permease subunit [Borreliella lusitaniae]|uniref:ABC transporter permease subunit n=1 Tax=Borreliella lusitaniae TaxID=100177 RepID=A0ABZ0CI67_9SPIR|nr:ABC transporter permease subunit [Borreliella lusitaniae]WKC85635.1 ABC transporter permease subunit [Borreliella lusitaniae]WNY68923.1 ABC transporter permease subunit [Borreliella lusitaniae]
MKVDIIVKKIYIILFGIFTVLLIITPALVNENSKIAIYKKDPNKVYLKPIEKMPMPPTKDNPLGIDKMGRDIMARLILATRNSILLSLSYATISAAIGIFIGAIIGMLNFEICMLISKLIEALQTLPFFYIVSLVFYYFLNQKTYNMIQTATLLALIHGWIRFAFIARNNTLIIKNLDYVKASEIMGASKIKIILRHIFPEVFSSISSIIPLQMARSLTTFEVVSFLQKQDKNLYPSLGELLNYMEMGNKYLWIWINPLFILIGINIILAIINLKLRKKMKHLISS